MPDPAIHIFVSHSGDDLDFALRLRDSLHARGIDAWVDQRNLEVGQLFVSEIQKAIEHCACVVVVLTPASMTSKWVLQEILTAQEANKPILPIMLKQTQVVMPLKGLHWINFRSESEYDRKLQDLQARIYQLTSSTRKSRQTDANDAPTGVLQETRAIPQRILQNLRDLAPPAPEHIPPDSAETEKQTQAHQAWEKRISQEAKIYYREKVLGTSSVTLRICASLFVGAGSAIIWIAATIIFDALYNERFPTWLQGGETIIWLVLVPVVPIALTLIMISRGYNRSYKGRTFFWTSGLTGFAIAVGIVVELLYIPDIWLQQYSIPLVGTALVDHSSPWGFALVWGLVSLLIFSLLYIPLCTLLDADVGEIIWIAIYTSIPAFIVGFLMACINEVIGWSSGGAVVGLVFGIIAGLLSIPRNSEFDLDAGVILCISEGCVVLVTLLSWLAGAFLFNIDGSLVLEWGLSALVGTAGGFGMGVTIHLWFVREETSYGK